MMDKKEIGIVVRDVNGKRTTFRFTDVTQFNMIDFSSFSDEEYEILLVTWGEFCIYSSIGSTYALSWDELVGYFA